MNKRNLNMLIKVITVNTHKYTVMNGKKSSLSLSPPPPLSLADSVLIALTHIFAA